MAGCAVLCISQKLHMIDEFGKIRAAEAIELLRANEAGNLTLLPLLFISFICVDYLMNNTKYNVG